MKSKPHVIGEVLTGSIAEEMGLEKGDAIVSINGQPIQDIFDYQYYIQDEYIEVEILTKDGETCVLEIDKDYEEDLGVTFENGLMDEYRSCHNNCIFCFIDQMPKGMRDTLYFKDDDTRLSFLQGNYVTLTNMSIEDIDRIARYHLSPINVSFQTTNPELRCKMLHNRFAGDILQKVDRLFEAGITMNGQIVLCKGVNDGNELERSLSDLYGYLPHLESVSVVPVGLSKYRDGLYPLEPFTKEDANQVIDCIETWQKKAFAEYNLHFVHASDEWYILAQRPLPEQARYDGYLQLENGVGMMRLLMEEFDDALKQKMDEVQKLQEAVASKEPHKTGAADVLKKKTRKVTLATGLLAAPFLEHMAKQAMDAFDGLQIQVVPIINHFFGERITVSGLLTAQDIMAQLKDLELGDEVLLPENVLRSGEDVFLDDVHLPEVSKTLQVPVNIVKSSGYDLLNGFLGR